MATGAMRSRFARSRSVRGRSVRGRSAGIAALALTMPAFFLAQSGGPAAAQGAPPATPPATVAPPSAGRPPAATLPQVVTAEVSGFRSARFGMTSEQVQEAIKRDFDIDAAKIGKLKNNLQKTDIQAIQVEELVPGSGTSMVFYVFGYSSQRLVHVNVVWGRQAQQTVPPATLVNTGRILQQYFLGQGFAKEGQVVNQALAGNQILLFQGFDEKKRAVQLVLDMTPVAPAKPADAKKAPAPAKPGEKSAPAAASGAKPAAQAGQAQEGGQQVQLVATSLRLSYIESMTNPDIYRIPKGKF